MSRGLRTGIRPSSARAMAGATCALLLGLVLAARVSSEGQAPPAAPVPAPAAAQTGAATAAPVNTAAAPVSPQRALVNQYCVACHNDRVKSGGLTLTELNLDAVGQHADV